ncbi:MAG: type II toxin-antitoxin system PemK/MazF family toxin [Actinobacteria bacterium]|nr:type II toxin-antitoxin system PemK/MazF family toxin [Actinomycetota bacterium]
MASVDEIWLVDFGEPYPAEPARHRPALIVGPTAAFGSELPFVIVCPLTTARRDLPVHVEIEPDPGNGLDAISYVQCELIRSINRRRMLHPIGRISSDRSFVVHDVLAILLGH